MRHQQGGTASGRFRTGLALTLALPALTCHGQDIEPRRWSHLPMGSNFIGGAYAYPPGEIAFYPLLGIEDAESELPDRPHDGDGAEEWRDAQDDSQEIGKKDLEHAFKAIYDRRPDADDDQWSLICAA